MTFTASKNDNGDLLVIVDDVVCVGVDKRWMDPKDKDNYDPDWQTKLPGRIAAKQNPRTEECCGELSDDDAKALDDAVQAAIK